MGGITKAVVLIIAPIVPTINKRKTKSSILRNPDLIKSCIINQGKKNISINAEMQKVRKLSPPAMVLQITKQIINKSIINSVLKVFLK